MKKLLVFVFIFVIAVYSNFLFAQIINVPDKSKDHFAKKYPTVEGVDWGNNVTSYSASFTLKKEKYKAHYHMDGTWDYTEKKMEASNFPSAVTKQFKNSRFAEWDVLSGAYVENSKGEKLYRYETKKGLERKYIFYDKNGKEIKTSTTL